MTIDIDKLTEAELVDLNHRIIERLRLLQQMRTHVAMLEFSIGERVEFQPDGRPVIAGIVTRYNTKTVTVITDTGARWRVAPRLLRRAAGTRPHTAAEANVIEFHGGEPQTDSDQRQ